MNVKNLTFFHTQPSFGGSGIKHFDKDCRYLESIVWHTKDGLITELRPMSDVFGAFSDSIWIAGEADFKKRTSNVGSCHSKRNGQLLCSAFSLNKESK